MAGLEWQDFHGTPSLMGAGGGRCTAMLNGRTPQRGCASPGGGGHGWVGEWVDAGGGLPGSWGSFPAEQHHLEAAAFPGRPAASASPARLPGRHPRARALRFGCCWQGGATAGGAPGCAGSGAASSPVRWQGEVKGFVT